MGRGHQEVRLRQPSSSSDSGFGSLRERPIVSGYDPSGERDETSVYVNALQTQNTTLTSQEDQTVNVGVLSS